MKEDFCKGIMCVWEVGAPTIEWVGVASTGLNSNGDHQSDVCFSPEVVFGVAVL